MEQRQIDTVELENGLTLELWDASCKVTADRWQVKLIARMRIEVSGRWFGESFKPPAELDQVRAKLGETQYYEYQSVRNFVDQKDKSTILEGMLDSVMAKKAYYRHPDFAARFLIKAYIARQAYPDLVENG